MNASRRLNLLVALVALGLVTTVALIGFALRPRERSVCLDDGCAPPRVSLPEAIRFGAIDPVVTIVVWIDLESTTSRQIYQHVTRAITAGRREIAVELRLLHLPATACPGPGESLGCLGARLVECAEHDMPGAGVHVAGALLDLQWRPPGERTADAAAAAITGLGLDAEALLACAANSRGVDATLRAHAELAARHGLVAAPGGLVFETADLRRSAGFGAWLTESSLRAIIRCLAQRLCEEVA